MQTGKPKPIYCSVCEKRCPEKEQIGRLPDLLEQGEIEQAAEILKSLKSQNLCVCDFAWIDNLDANEPGQNVNRRDTTPWWVFYPELRHKVVEAFGRRPGCPYKPDHLEKWMVDHWIRKQKVPNHIGVTHFRMAEFAVGLFEGDPAARSAELKAKQAKAAPPSITQPNAAPPSVTQPNAATTGNVKHPHQSAWQALLNPRRTVEDFVISVMLLTDKITPKQAYRLWNRK
jgi:hypothetical protein